MPCASVRRTARHRLRHVAASRGASRGASAPPAFSPFFDPAPVVSFGFPRRPSLGGPRQGGWAARPRCARSARPTYCANALRQPTACSGRATSWHFVRLNQTPSAAAARLPPRLRELPVQRPVRPRSSPAPGPGRLPSSSRGEGGGGSSGACLAFLFHPFRFPG